MPLHYDGDKELKVVRHQVQKEDSSSSITIPRRKFGEMKVPLHYDGDGLTDSEDGDSDHEDERDWEEKREKKQEEEEQEEQLEEEQGVEQEEKRDLPSSPVAIQTPSTGTELPSYHKDKENNLNCPSPAQASRANSFLQRIISGQNQKKRNKVPNTTTAPTVTSSTMTSPSRRAVTTSYNAVTTTASTTATRLTSNTVSTFSTHLSSPSVPSSALSSSSSPKSVTSTLNPSSRPSLNNKQYSPVSEALDKVMSRGDNVYEDYHNEEQTDIFADPDDPPWVLPTGAKNIKKHYSKANFKPRKVNTPGAQKVSADDSDDISPPAPVSSKKYLPGKPRKAAPPVNPIHYRVTDSTGKEISREDPLYRHHFVNSGKHSKETRKAMDAEWKRFIEFVINYPDYGEKLANDLMEETIEDAQIADIFSNYLENRINLTRWQAEGEIVPLDLTTMERVWTYISTKLFMELGVKVAGNPKFDSARGTKARICKYAKEEYNLGNHAHQAVELGRAVINALLLSDTLNEYQPFPLVALTYIQIVLIFMPRVRKEAYNLKRGDFQFKYDKNGNPLCILYCPMGPLKKNQGMNPSTNKASFLLKRAAALPCPSMPKFCLFNLFKILFSHLDRLPFTGDRKNQRLWYKLRQGRVKDTDCFFEDQNLGIDTFDAITSDAIRCAGIDMQGVTVSNQSLRVQAFNLHTLLGFETGATATNAGHSSEKTQRIYKRQCFQDLCQIGGAVQRMATGVDVSQPDCDWVLFRDGTVRRPVPFIPWELNAEEGTINMGLISMSEKEVEVEVEVDMDVERCELLSCKLVSPASVRITEEQQVEPQSTPYGQLRKSTVQVRF